MTYPFLGGVRVGVEQSGGWCVFVFFCPVKINWIEQPLWRALIISVCMHPPRNNPLTTVFHSSSEFRKSGERRSRSGAMRRR